MADYEKEDLRFAEVIETVGPNPRKWADYIASTIAVKLCGLANALLLVANHVSSPQNPNVWDEEGWTTMRALAREIIDIGERVLAVHNHGWRYLAKHWGIQGGPHG